MAKFQKIDLHKYVKPSKYLKLLEGENRIRILTDGYIYRVVGKKTARGYVRHIIGDGEIPNFLQDVEPKLTYGFVVFSFDTEHFHVLESGPTLGDMLTVLLKLLPDEQYKAKDILIGRSGYGLDTKYEVAYAEESFKLPEGADKNNPEFQMMMRNFDE